MTAKIITCTQGHLALDLDSGSVTNMRITSCPTCWKEAYDETRADLKRVTKERDERCVSLANRIDVLERDEQAQAVLKLTAELRTIAAIVEPVMDKPAPTIAEGVACAMGRLKEERNEAIAIASEQTAIATAATLARARELESELAHEHAGHGDELGKLRTELAWLYNITAVTNVPAEDRAQVDELLRLERERLNRYREKAARVDELEAELARVKTEVTEACAKEVESLMWPPEELDDRREDLNNAFKTAAQSIRIRTDPLLHEHWRVKALEQVAEAARAVRKGDDSRAIPKLDAALAVLDKTSARRK